jgi:hypothetical protein
MSAPSLAAPQEQQELGNVSSPEKASDVPESEELPKLPEPLNKISGNLTDIERTRYFRIIDGGYGRTTRLNEKAMIWTVEVIKPITCGHAMILLNRLGDVRFYRVVDEDYRQQLLTTRLYYSSWLEEGAVSHEILGRDERFEIWLLLDEQQIWVLEHNGANEVVFALPKRRHPAHKDLWRETRRYRSPEAHLNLGYNPVGAH